MVLRTYALLGMACLFVLQTSSATAKPVVVAVAGGSVRGTLDADGSVAMFKGIPYAAPPVGELRWRDPQPARPWTGVLDATRFSKNCIQAPPVEFLPYTKEFLQIGASSEDCLYLNVWAPASVVGQHRAVYVFIHGGAFMGGSGDVPIYDGENLAKKGIIVVTFNYRLGALGFLAHPDLDKESPHHTSGNYGLLDQLAALKWVQQNIAAFGGDPGKVTIGGQSAGAASVRMLLSSPLATGVFRAGVMESGTGLSNMMATSLTNAEKAGEAFAKAHGAATIAQLRALPAQALAAPGPGDFDPKKGPMVIFSPCIDGYFITEASSTENGAKVPVLTGWNTDENFGPPPSRETFLEQSRMRYGSFADEFLKLYPAADEQQAHSSQAASALQRRLVSLQLWAGDSTAPVYTYLFARAAPWPQHPEFKVFHTADVPYIFDNLDKVDRPYEPTDYTVEKTFSSYLVNFVNRGDPNGTGLPHWPRFKPGKFETLEIGSTVRPVRVAAPDAVTFWREYLVSPEARKAPPMM